MSRWNAFLINYFSASSIKDMSIKEEVHNDIYTNSFYIGADYYYYSGSTLTYAIPTALESYTISIVYNG